MPIKVSKEMQERVMREVMRMQERMEAESERRMSAELRDQRRKIEEMQALRDAKQRAWDADALRRVKEDFDKAGLGMDDGTDDGPRYEQRKEYAEEMRKRRQDRFGVFRPRVKRPVVTVTFPDSDAEKTVRLSRHFARRIDIED